MTTLPVTIKEADRKLLETLINDLQYHNYRYYVLDDPIIPDPVYDAMYQKYLDYQAKYPELPLTVGVTQPGNTIEHQTTMLSLRSVKDMTSAMAMFVKYDTLVSAELKVDGLAVELCYIRTDSNKVGRHLASTRGDGVRGEDITTNIAGTEIPATLECDRPVTIYGEVHLPKLDLTEINHQRALKRLPLYSNPRNAAAGILRAKEPSDYLDRLKFYPYRIHGLELRTQQGAFEWLDANGFDTLPEFRQLISSQDEMRKYWEHTRDNRKNIPIDVDGIVLKFDDLALQESLGTSSTHPHWAVAVKFEPERVTTRLNEVIFQVGKSGIVAPVGLVEPVTVGGVVVRRASLANIRKIHEKGIMIHDEVLLERANDVIPQIVEPIVEDRSGQEIPIVFPEVCPSCQHPLEFHDPHYMCTSMACSGQTVGRLITAVGRHGFDIDGLGPSRISELVEHQALNDLSDLFLLDTDEVRQHLMRVTLGYGDKVVNRLNLNIAKARKVPLDRFIRALTIPGVGRTMSAMVAERCLTLDRFVKIPMLGLEKLPHVSTDVQDGLVRWSKVATNIELIERCLANGVQVLDYKLKSTSHTTVAITGTLSSPRSALEAKALLAGWKVVGKVNAKTDYLVVGENPGTAKLGDAQKYGVKQISEHEFIQHIGGA